MEKESSMFKSSIYYGAIIGAGLIILSVVLYVLGYGFEKWAGYLTYLVLIGGIIWATIQFRDARGTQGLTYGQALGFGVLISLVAAIVNAIYSYLFFTVIDPDAINVVKTMAEEQMLQQGISDEQIEAAMQIQGKFMKPGMMAIMTVPSLTFIGFIISLISSIFLKRDPDIFQEEA